MSTYNIYFHGEIRKILGGYPLLSGAIENDTIFEHFNFTFENEEVL